MLEGAGACIIVLGNEDKTDVWVEDCSNVILTMHYMASSLGLGSCWIQGRNRVSSTEEIQVFILFERFVIIENDISAIFYDFII